MRAFRKFIRASLILLVTLLPCSALRTVVIDAGHGGRDNGGSWGKVYEKHLALDTAFRLQRYLKMKGYRTVMTRKSDRYLSLAQRSAVANRYRNAIFVSIHINKASRTGASGVETFYCSSKSRKLASCIQEKILKKVRTTNRGSKYARYFVLRRTKIPAVLVEIGFVSNSSDRNRLKKGYYRDAMAKAIADGIAKYD